MTDVEVKGARLSIRQHLIVGLSVVALLACGLGGWASTAEISGLSWSGIPTCPVLL